MFYSVGMRVEYREEECRSALNRVKGMPFGWSLNPYTGCAHRCTFCYVRAFEQRADRPSDDRYGRSIRVKVNVADVLARELGRRSWRRETVAIGAALEAPDVAEGAAVRAAHVGIERPLERHVADTVERRATRLLPIRNAHAAQYLSLIHI